MDEAEESSNEGRSAERGTLSDAEDRDRFNGRGIRLRTEARNEGDRRRFRCGGSSRGGSTSNEGDDGGRSS